MKKSHLKFSILISFLFFLSHSEVSTSKWTNADTIECKPRTDGTPYCQPKTFHKSFPTTTNYYLTNKQPSLYTDSLNQILKNNNLNYLLENTLRQNQKTNSLNIISNSYVITVQNKINIFPVQRKQTKIITVDSSKNQPTLIYLNSPPVTDKTNIITPNFKNKPLFSNLVNLSNSNSSNNINSSLLNRTNGQSNIFSEANISQIIIPPVTNQSQILFNNINQTANINQNDTNRIASLQPQIVNQTTSNSSLDLSSLDLSNITITNIAPITLQQPLNFQTQTPSISTFTLNNTSNQVDSLSLPNPISVPYSQITPQIINQNTQTSNPIIFTGQTSSLLTGGVDVSNLLNTINSPLPNLTLIRSPQTSLSLNDLNATSSANPSLLANNNSSNLGVNTASALGLYLNLTNQNNRN